MASLLYILHSLCVLHAFICVYFGHLNYSFNCDRYIVFYNNWLHVDVGHGALRLVEIAEQLPDISFLLLTREAEFGVVGAAETLVVLPTILLFLFTDELKPLRLLIVNFFSVGARDIGKVRRLILSFRRCSILKV